MKSYGIHHGSHNDGITIFLTVTLSSRMAKVKIGVIVYQSKL